MCLMIETACPSATTIARLGRCDNPNVPACTETCNFASDGNCDDGGPGSEFFNCARGSDCTDCGVRQPPLDHSNCRVLGTGLCGTVTNLNNCGTDDVYRLAYRMRSPPPPPPPPPPRKPPPQSPSPAPPPSGCRNSNALNYRPFAVVDDGSCLT